MENSVTELFNKFAGREVPLVEKPYEIKIGEKTITGTQLELANDNDPTLAEMNELAEQNGLSLRVFWPGIMGTADIQPNRINAHLEEGADGKWRVSGNFTLG